MSKEDSPDTKSKSRNGKPSPKKKDFLVVGLGASAGGVKALQEFFATMPPNSGMAFVAILHLSPEHESNLAAILQAQTKMRVTQVLETVKVEPNQVYVISPNQQLEMIDGVIRPAAAERLPGYRVAIDVFFRTLAEAYERNAICIVLSGTGSDGTLGLKRVKESNGFAIVQDPEDAEYDSMPRSAINTQLADWILPVNQMPEKLLGFKESSKRLHLTDGDTTKVADEIRADESLREILTLLRARTGHDFSYYKTPTLVRRIARHLQIHELEDIPSYLEILRNNQNEVQSLLKNLLINVTNFFRDKEAFETLEKEVIPNLFDGKTGKDTVRVWSAGCASGEEAYSLAILLSEHADKLSDPPKFQVFASDVDDEAIAEAREHRYPESIEADVSAERLKRFFIKEGGFYLIKKDLRETVLFAPHNVLRDPPFSRLDLISCRNVLIYLNRETQGRLLHIFHFALNTRGYLFLGSSESAEGAPVLFAPINKKCRIYSRRLAPVSQTGLPIMPVVGRWDVKLLDDTKTENLRIHAATVSEIHYKLLEQYAPSSVLVNQDFDIIYSSGAAGKFLRFTGGEPSRNLLKVVNPELLPDLRAALFTARQENKSSKISNVRVLIDGKEVFVNLIVHAVDIEDKARDFLLVIFEENQTEAKTTENRAKQAAGKDAAMQMLISRLEDDLQRSKELLRATIEQHETTVEELKTSNEELQAINEELRSASEELETSKEELQSVNEELTTVNHELKEKFDEANRANADLQNLVQSTDIGTIFLDRALRVKRYTPRILEIFNIIPSDIGRPLDHLTHRLDYDFLTQDAREVIENLNMKEREVRGGSEDSRYLVRLAPYRTLDDKIDGVVLSFQDITDLKRESDALIKSEQDLRESEERLRLATEAAEMYSWEYDVAEKNYKFSENAAQILQITPENLPLTIKDTFKIAHPEDKPLIEKALKEAIQCGDGFTLDFRSITQEGETIWLSVQSAIIKDAGGNTARLIGIAQNVTARKQAEEALRESEEHMRIAIEAGELATWEWDLVSDRVYWNERHFLIFGMKPSKKPMKPEDFFYHVHPEDRSWVGKRLQKAITEKIVFKAEFRALIDNGETRWMSGYGRVTEVSSNGQATKISGVMLDITERKQIEEGFRKSEEQLHLVLESTKDYAIITFDIKGNITRWNKGAKELFGYTEQEIVGQYSGLLFTPEDRAAQVPEKEMQTALKKGRADDERWHLRRDGSRFFVSGVMQPLRDGKVEGFVKIARDQTERLKAEESLQEKEILHRLVSTQEDERRRIARDLHDHFGQQMTALRLKLEALKKICDDEKICEGIDEADEIAVRLDAEVDFLAWELRPASLDDLGLRLTLADYVKEWANHTKIAAEFHTSGIGKARLGYELETNLYRIAQEALNNIYKHAKAKSVSVLLEKRKDSIALIIEDDGIGFNPKSKKIKEKGLGLTGMGERAAIVGGTLEIESAPQKGTTIFVRVSMNKKEAAK